MSNCTKNHSYLLKENTYINLLSLPTPSSPPLHLKTRSPYTSHP